MAPIKVVHSLGLILCSVMHVLQTRPGSPEQSISPKSHSLPAAFSQGFQMWPGRGWGPPSLCLLLPDIPPISPCLPQQASRAGAGRRDGQKCHGSLKPPSFPCTVSKELQFQSTDHKPRTEIPEHQAIPHFECCIVGQDRGDDHLFIKLL